MSTPTAPPLLKTITSRRELAFHLGINYRKFAYIAFFLPGPVKYRSFKIAKRGGGEREINAPKWPLLKLQKTLAHYLDQIYKPRDAVNGFVRNRSVITNARIHLRSRWVLNIDLKDFFHAIHFGRVRGRLEANPYGLSPRVAHAIANIACFSGRLPQGGALSPVLSNMVSDRLDGELSRLCRKFKCRYTRYADDITISTNARRFPRTLAYYDDSDETPSLVIGDALAALIKNNDFEINDKKSRLSGRSDRQEVTGIIINCKLNVPRKFVRQIRAMMHAWEKFGLQAAQAEHLSKYRTALGRLSRHDIGNFEYILRGKLEFLRSVQGENQPVCRALLLRFNGLLDRSTAPFKLLPFSAIELLNESTYCLDIENKMTIKDGVLVEEASTGTAFFLRDVGLVTCAHCVGDSMEIYHPDRPKIKYTVKCLAKDDLSDVAVLILVSEMEIQPRSQLEATSALVQHGDEVRAAGFPSKFPEGQLSVARTHVDGFFDRSRHAIWQGDQTVRYLISRGIPDGVSGGPVLNEFGKVIGIGAKGPGEDDHLIPSEVIPISAVKNLLDNFRRTDG